RARRDPSGETATGSGGRAPPARPRSTTPDAGSSRLIARLVVTATTPDAVHPAIVRNSSGAAARPRCTAPVARSIVAYPSLQKATRVPSGLLAIDWPRRTPRHDLVAPDARSTTTACGTESAITTWRPSATELAITRRRPSAAIALMSIPGSVATMP